MCFLRYFFSFPSVRLQGKVADYQTKGSTKHHLFKNDVLIKYAINSVSYLFLAMKLAVKIVRILIQNNQGHAKLGFRPCSCLFFFFSPNEKNL